MCCVSESLLEPHGQNLRGVGTSPQRHGTLQKKSGGRLSRAVDVWAFSLLQEKIFYNYQKK